jgi:hemolysin activation/secretion protein
MKMDGSPKMPRHMGWKLLTGSLLLAGVPAAYGQSLPALPGAVQPGRGTLPPAIEEQQHRPPEAKLQFSIPTQNRSRPTPKAGQELRFTLRAIQVEGASIVGPDFYDPLIQPLLGHPVTLAEVAALADAIQDRYAALGYVLSRAYVPAQELADGTLRIRVIEGHIDRLLVEKTDAAITSRLTAMTADAVAARPARIDLLERALLLADDLPGTDINAVLRPGADFGSADLVVNVARQPWGGSAGIGNHGSDYAGPWSLYADLYANGLLGQEEQIGLTASGTPDSSEQRAVNARYQQPLGGDGWLLTSQGSWSRARPGASLSPFAIRTESWSAGQRVSYPFIRSRTLNLQGEVGWTAQQAKVGILGFPYTQDDWRTLEGQLTLSWSGWAGTAFQLSTGLTQGLDVLGASPNAGKATSRTGIDKGFTKLEGQATGSVRLADGLAATLSLSGQWTDDVLVAGEEFVLGGSRFGRGYNSGDLAGPRGVAASAELQYRLPWSGRIVQAATVYAYADWGRVWQSVALDADLTSIGGGIRLALPAGFSLSGEVAAPLTKLDLPGLRDPDPRFFLDLAVSF